MVIIKEWILIDPDGTILPIEMEEWIFKELNNYIQMDLRKAKRYTTRKQFYKDIAEIIFKKEK